MKGTNLRSKEETDDRWAVLRAKIEAHGSLLAEQGSLTLKTIKGHRYVSLRFLGTADGDGKQKHHSIYIGREADDELVSRVRQLLDRYRARQRWIDEVARYATFAAAAKALVRTQIRRLSRSRRAKAACDATT